RRRKHLAAVDATVGDAGNRVPAQAIDPAIPPVDRAVRADRAAQPEVAVGELDRATTRRRDPVRRVDLPDDYLERAARLADARAHAGASRRRRGPGGTRRQGQRGCLVGYALTWSHFCIWAGILGVYDLGQLQRPRAAKQRSAGVARSIVAHVRSMACDDILPAAQLY